LKNLLAEYSCGSWKTTSPCSQFLFDFLLLTLAWAGKGCYTAGVPADQSPVLCAFPWGWDRSSVPEQTFPLCYIFIILNYLFSLQKEKKMSFMAFPWGWYRSSMPEQTFPLRYISIILNYLFSLQKEKKMSFMEGGNTEK